MTKPGTIRWKRVPSKKRFRTSAANDEVVQGELFTSRRMSKLPKFVRTSTVYAFDLSSSGNVTCLPLMGHGDPAFALPPPPHPASTTMARPIIAATAGFARRGSQSETSRRKVIVARALARAGLHRSEERRVGKECRSRG